MQRGQNLFRRLINWLGNFAARSRSRININYELVLFFLSNKKDALKSLFWGRLQKLQSGHHPVFYSITFTIIVIFFYGAFKANPVIQAFMANNLQSLDQWTSDWTGILYGLIVSMILVRSWERLDKLGNSLSKEAHSILSLTESMILAEKEDEGASPAVKNLEHSINCYIEHVDSHYGNESNTLNDAMEGDSILAGIEKEFEQAITDHPELGKYRLLQKLNGVMDARKDRLINSNARLPSSIQVLLFASSCLWLFSFILSNFDGAWLNYIFIGVIVFTVFTITGVSLSFYEPTSTNWNDTTGSWKQLRSKIK
jgi:hypothetical protein